MSEIVLYYNTLRKYEFGHGGVGMSDENAKNLRGNMDYTEKVNKINALSNDLDGIYHQASRKLGISDSVLIVLYEIYVSGGSCPLNSITKNNGISKQTVNSAVRRLEADGLICLEPYKGKSKRVALTEKGSAFAENTAGRLFKTECGVFRGWTQQEIDIYLALSERFNISLREQIENWSI